MTFVARFLGRRLGLYLRGGDSAETSAAGGQNAVLRRGTTTGAGVHRSCDKMIAA
ncbi:MAG: hypothetical protein ACRD1K_15845 [Acidimicrobiales bacterium]